MSAINHSRNRAPPGFGLLPRPRRKFFQRKHEGLEKSLSHRPQEQDEACFWYANVRKKAENGSDPPLKAVDDAIVECKYIETESAVNLHWVIEGDGARG